MKILALNDCASVATTLMRHVDEVDLLMRLGHHRAEFLPVLDLSGARVRLAPRMGGFDFLMYFLKAVEGYDLVHVSGWACIYPYLAGMPYGVLFHGTDIRGWEQSRGVKSMCRVPLEWAALRGARYVAVSTSDLLPIAKKHRRDAFYMPNPIEVSETTEATGSRALSPHRIDETKGHSLLFEAVRGLPLEVDQVDWGIEPMWSSVKAAAPDNVKFIPLIPHGEMNAAYDASRMVLGQLLIGAVGMSELEAAARRRPVVCYSRYGFPGLKAQPTIESIRSLVKRLLYDRSYAATVADAQREYVKRNPEATQIAEKWRNIWGDAVE